MIYEILEFKMNGFSVLEDIKINADMRQKLARVRCSFVNKDTYVEMDHSLSWSTVGLEFPNCVFTIRGNENNRDIYYEVACKYSMLKKAWSFSGMIGDTRFNWDKLSMAETCQKVLEIIASC